MSELAGASAADGRSHPVVSASQAPAEQPVAPQCKGHASTSSSNANQNRIVPPDGSPSEDNSIGLDERIRSALSDGDFPKRVPVNGCPVRTACEGDSDVSDDSDSGDEPPGVMGYMPLPQDPDTDVDSSCGCVGVGVSDESTVSSPPGDRSQEGCVVSTQGATSAAKVTTPLKKGELEHWNVAK